MQITCCEVVFRGLWQPSSIAANLPAAPEKKKAVRILTASARVQLTLWALWPADPRKGVAPHSLLARHFSWTAGACCSRRAFRFARRQWLVHVHMPPCLSHSNRHSHREHYDGQSLKHRPLPRFSKMAADMAASVATPKCSHIRYRSAAPN